jgi:tetratricopeptide (TPR) repeat protein
MKKKVFKKNPTSPRLRGTEERKKVQLIKFPHFSRFINARLLKDIILVLLVLFVLFVLGFNYLYPQTSFEKAKINLFLKPFAARSYIDLADLYIEYNDYTAAKRELKTAVFFAKNNDEANDATKKLLDLERDERSREDIEREIIKWEKVISEKHNYRDAYFRLAVLNYQIFKNEAARQYLDKAMALDPNFEEGKRLKELL